MEWMQSANAKLAKTSVSKVERTFRQDCSMSGFPKGFIRISKVRLVNVFLEKVFLMQHAMQCKGETNNMVCNATRGG